jgi:hypothetical protein
MAKAKTSKTSKAIGTDTHKIHEIIGRALTDKKFADALTRNPRKVAADYGLEEESANLLHKGVKLRGELHTVAKKLHKGSSLDYQAI